MPKFVAYYRVSTERQGRSGLGLEAQQAAVHAHIGCHELVAEFTEIESGRYCGRPKLSEAIALARRSKATLVIAKLDRLARNVGFIANLMDAGVDFLAADMPAANRFTIQIMAAVGEHEARMISERTRAALAAARARGVQLGNLKNLQNGREKARETIMKQADESAAKVLPMVRDAARGGVGSVHKIADLLNSRGVATRRGGRWTGSSVLKIVRRSGFSSLGELAATAA